MHRLIKTACMVLALAVTSAAAWANPFDDAGFRTMVAADRAFAAKSRAEGIRASFLAYLASDSLIFLPELRLARPYYEGRTFISTLDWGPAAGEVSGFGDMGYTIGPGVVSVPPPLGPYQFGTYYLSIWERDTGGHWKVALDDGIGVDIQPIPVSTQRLGPTSTPLPPLLLPVQRNMRLQSLTLADRALARALSTQPSTAYAAFRRADCVFLREGRLPLVGAAADPVLAGLPAREIDSLQVARMAWSGDLAFTAGVSSGANGTPLTHYVRVWRHAEGGWKLAADVTTYE